MKKLTIFIALFIAIFACEKLYSEVIWAWGANWSGRLGDGTTTQRTSPLQIGIGTDWESVSAGEQHTIAIKNDGTLWAWGNNSSGRLGDGTTTNRSSPVQIGSDTNWDMVSAGSSHTLAIKSVGSLWAWGWNSKGQLGDGTYTTRTSPKQIGSATNWNMISVGHDYSIAIKSDGTLWAWGANVYGQHGNGTTSSTVRNPTKIGTGTDWVFVSAGRFHTIAIKSNGTLWACGVNWHGRLGDGTTTQRTSLVQIGEDDDWDMVSAGSSHTIAIKSDGTLWAWGYNGSGQLGVGDTTQRHSPVQIGEDDDWDMVSTGSSHTLAIKNDGSLWAWGSNGSGRLGDGTTTSRLSPVQIGTETDWESVSTGDAHTLATKFGTALVTPQNQATNLPLVAELEVAEVENADEYTIQISTSSNFDTDDILLDETITTTTLTVPVSTLNFGTTYYWRANVTRNEVTSGWTQSRSFTTIPPVPQAPSLSSPVNNATNQLLALTLDWNAVQYAESYDVQVSTQSNFSTTIVDENITDIDIAMSGLNNITTYYWRVRAKNVSGTSDWSVVWNFTTVPPIPAVPTLALPSNNATNQLLALTLDWNTVQYAESYDVQVSLQNNFSTIVYSGTNLTGTDFDLTGLSTATTYYWRARAKNISGTSGWSTIWSFATVPPVPQSPSLSSPVNNATNQLLALTLDWNTVQYAESYDVQVSIQSNFSTIAYSGTNLTGTDFDLTGLSTATTYYWRARAKNISGTSSWSEAWSFSTVPPVPQAPSLSSPVNNATNQLLALTLDWNAVQYAESYDVQVSLQSNFSTIAYSGTNFSGTVFDLTGLSTATTYYWRARAKNISGTSGWSGIWAFTTVPPVPQAPSLSSPVNNATNQLLALTLDWNTVQYAESYDVQVSLQSNFSTIAYSGTNLTGTDFDLTGLSTATTYYWRARAKNISGTSNWSGIWAFTTVPPVPQAPSLSSPVNEATNQQLALTLDWNTVQYAESYDVQVSLQSNFSTIAYSGTNLTGTDFDLTGLTTATTYYWRARAKNISGTSGWSTIWSFTTLVAPPQTPTLSSPANNSEDVATNVTVSWNTVQNATSYKLQIADNNGFNSPVIDVANITATEYQTSSLDRSTEYFWRVRAVNVGGESAWSSVWSFETMEADPVPSSWDFTDLTGNNSIVVLPTDAEPKIEDRDFQKGDAVGFFFELDGDLVCAGYSVWDNENMAITVWGDDQETDELDGYVHNETYKVKIWDGQLGRELSAEFTFSFGSSKYSNNGYSIFGSLKGVSTVIHSFYVTSGWNLISSYVEPENDSLKVVFNANLTKLILLKNNAGQVFIPQYNINTIGQWQYKQGYQAFMNSGDTIKVKGLPLKPETVDINLASGWNMVGYLRNSPLSAPQALVSLTDDSKLVLAKNNAGQVYIPQYGINTIGSMQPGQGYQMFLSSAGILTYPANSLGKFPMHNITPMPKYLIAENQRTGSSAVAIIELESGFGNEIGIYNSRDELIGSGVVNNGVAAVTIWGNNEQTIVKDGAMENELLRARLFDTKTRTFRNLDISNLLDLTTGLEQNTLQYSDNGIFTAKATIADITADDILRVSPNPASESITIELLPTECNYSSLKIYSSVGGMVADLSNELLSLSGNIITFATSELPSGEYNIILNCQSEQVTQKIIIVK